MTLFKPVIDVDRTPYCGPTAISALTGVPITRIEKMIRRGRRGYRDRNGRKIPIKGSYASEVVSVLKRLGCKVTKMENPETTFGRFCADTININAAFLVNVTGHFMTMFKGTYCDNGTLDGPKPADGYHKQARRVRRAWKVEAPTEPRYTINDPIVTERPPKPKPDIKKVRYERTLSKIKTWEAKAKRANTALKKLRRQQTYYERSLTV